MKLLIDVFGSDCPEALIAGCARCSLEVPEATLVLPGREDVLRPALEALPHDPSRIELLPAETVITNHDDPIQAVMKRRDSSLVTGIQRLRSDPEVGGMITAGSTGAAFAAGVAFAGRLPGVRTPALATFLPSEKGRDICLADCGANVDCKPDRLAGFALLGTALMQSYGVERPRVGLLSVGVEEGKGSHFVQEAYACLEQLPINFAGHMEARDALSGDYDVIVCEGFSGNVLLKTVEGAGLFAGSRLKRHTQPAVLEAARELTQELDFARRGASMLLGLRKPLFKAHGSATEDTVPNAVRQLLRFLEADYPAHLAALFAALDNGL